MKPFVTAIICIAAVILLVIIIAAVKKSRKKASTPSTLAPMPEVSKDTLDIVNSVRADVEEEKRQLRENPQINEIDPEDLDMAELEDLLAEFDPDELTEATVSSERDLMPEQKKPKVTKLAEVEDKTDMPVDSTKIPDCVRAYLDNNYTLNGCNLNDGAVSPVFMALHGKNIRASSDFDGKQLEILVKDSDVCLINPSAKEYFELNDRFFKLLGKSREDLGVDNIGCDPKLALCVPDVFEASVDGRDAVCFNFVTDDKNVRIYTADDSIILINSLDKDGSLLTSIKADSFIPYKADDSISLDGLKKSSMISFFKELL